MPSSFDNDFHGGEPGGTDHGQLWRSLADFQSRSPLDASRRDEFPPGATAWPGDFSRREFVELMGASLALVAMAGCNRPPEKKIVPHVNAPERALRDGGQYYATAMPWEGYARGVLALSHSGRPTKLEGNPAHPDSRGATDALTQAAVLSLYDPDRSRTPRHHGRPVPWTQFEDEWLTLHRHFAARRGAGLALLTEPDTSPTLIRGLHELLDRFPEAQWFQHTPLARYDQNGFQEDYDFSRADVVLAIDADFLFQHPSALRYTRAFTERRRIRNGKVNANRFYAIEPMPTVTGSMADHRLSASPRRTRELLRALGATLEGSALPADLAARERNTLAALARDLREHAPNVLCVAGPHCDADVRAFTAKLNARLRADGVTRHALPVVRSDADSRASGDLRAAVAAMRNGKVDTLVMVSTNPVYTAPGDLDFASALKQVPRRIHLGSHVDEAAAMCQWHVPESHFLEQWSDLRAFEGTASIVQPLIAPLYESRSATEFVFFLAEPPGRSGYDLVRATWQQQKPDIAPADFDHAWDQWLSNGTIPGTTASRSVPGAATLGDLTTTANQPGLELLIRPDPTINDGRWANNGWLQELPKPLTQLVWDNAAHVSPGFAISRGLHNGELVEIAAADGGRSALNAPVWITPGHAEDCVTVHLGYGRTRAGKVAAGCGFDAYPLRSAEHPWTRAGVVMRRLGRRRTLVTTQEHFVMEGRDLIRIVTAQDPRLPRPEERPSLYPKVEYEGYRWGMVIDLGTCTGCKACVTACQAENNIPVVGRDQVARGREMHWLRVDRYYSGDPANPQFLHQPVPCMQCENAPCELVCPVAATVHSSEGLNDMVYNRCVGTRYCSNNCPYKVRRFNFLDYRPPAGSTVYLQDNPNVTVRARGVMEKCTYCVQRINAGRISAEKENRRIRDGEVRTACQQACPAGAIVFGDLNDVDAGVRARKAEPTEYVLLGELNTRPRTTYLAKLINPAADAARAGAGA